MLKMLTMEVLMESLIMLMRMELERRPQLICLKMELNRSMIKICFVRTATGWCSHPVRWIKRWRMSRWVLPELKLEMSILWRLCTGLENNTGMVRWRHSCGWCLTVEVFIYIRNTEASLEDERTKNCTDQELHNVKSKGYLRECFILFCKYECFLSYF